MFAKHRERAVKEVRIKTHLYFETKQIVTSVNPLVNLPTKR
jgi:hypothetical protein